MFKLGSIVNDIETKRRQDIRLANHSNRRIKNTPSKHIPQKPIMLDKSTMTENKTKSIQTDTLELETIAKEISALEKFKKAQLERAAKAEIMNSFLGPPKAELYDVEDE
jgi:hypothetical protein